MKPERSFVMGSLVSLIIIAAIGGVAVTLQAQFMGLMDRGIGSLESVFITYGSGGVLIGMVMLLNRGGNLSAWRGLPWYSLTAGLLGLIIVGTIGYSTPRLGLVVTLTILVASQFIVGALLDHFGILGAVWRPLDLPRLAGIGVMLLGVWLVVR
jgi:transporter family-2 protein